MHQRNNQGSSSRRERGFSLVELMVAVAVGLMLLVGLISLVVNTSRSQQELQEVARQIENGRYASKVLTDQIRHAGYFGQYYDVTATPGSLENPCTTNVGNIDQTDLALPIQGYDDVTGTPPIGCLADANHLDGTDILVVRRASTATTATGNLQANEVYIQARPTNFVIDNGDAGTGASGAFNLTDLAGNTADIRKYRTDIYFVSPCSVPSGANCDGSADGGDPIPTLKRLQLTTDGSNTVMQREPLVEGVQQFQVEYGIDRNDDGAPDESTPGTSADAYQRANNVSGGEWVDVMAVRMHILVRNIELSPDYTDTKSYNMGLEGTVGPFNDEYRRHVFTTVARAVNPSSRRAQQ